MIDFCSLLCSFTCFYDWFLWKFFLNLSFFSMCHSLNDLSLKWSIFCLECFILRQKTLLLHPKLLLHLNELENLQNYSEFQNKQGTTLRILTFLLYFVLLSYYYIFFLRDVAPKKTSLTKLFSDSEEKDTLHSKYINYYW